MAFGPLSKLQNQRSVILPKSRRLERPSAETRSPSNGLRAAHLPVRLICRLTMPFGTYRCKQNGLSSTINSMGVNMTGEMGANDGHFYR